MFLHSSSRGQSLRGQCHNIASPSPVVPNQPPRQHCLVCTAVAVTPQAAQSRLKDPGVAQHPSTVLQLAGARCRWWRRRGQQATRSLTRGTTCLVGCLSQRLCSCAEFVRRLPWPHPTGIFCGPKCDLVKHLAPVCSKYWRGVTFRKLSQQQRAVPLAPGWVSSKMIQWLTGLTCGLFACKQKCKIMWYTFILTIG